MENSISQSERLDIFLALATLYEFKVDNNSIQSQSELALRSLSALNEDDLKKLKERAKRFESLSLEKQKNWQSFWLEKLRNKGQTRRLDENIHPENIARSISNEPQIIQQMIYENLPIDLAKLVASYLPNDPTNTLGQNKALPIDETANIIRNKFLSNFISFEDLYQPNSIDELSAKKLEEFIWKLGIRETAIACRGINTKENLAIFLKPFDDEVTKEIAVKISDLQNLTSHRVVIAEKIVRETFIEDADSDEKLRNLGLKILAIILALKDYKTRKFTLQKLPIVISEKCNTYIKEFEINNENYFEEISEEILELAMKLKDVEI